MIYFDYAATTPISENAKKAVVKTLEDFPGNPSSIHTCGIKSKKKYNATKKTVASLLGTTHKNLIFTGSGSEASNTAIKGVYQRFKDKTIVTTTVEHAATKESVAYVEADGGDVAYCPVDNQGFVDMEALETLLKTKDVSLVSVIHANNEVGTLQDIKALRKLTREYGALLHLDMVQSAPHMALNLDDMGIDFASFSAHKFFGPRGTGILYFKDKDSFNPLIHGGHQEMRKRAGTENLANIVALSTALEDTIKHVGTQEKTIKTLGTHFLKRLEESGIEYRLNGPSYENDMRLHNVLNIGFKHVHGGQLAFELDQLGFCVSQGSACHEDSIKTSHVLKGIHVPSDYIKGSIRFSFSHRESTSDIDQLVDALKTIIESGDAAL